MRIEKYIKLKTKFEDKSFENTYGSLDKMLYYSSFFGNFASIFFAFFFLNQLLFRATSDFSGRFFILSLFSLTFLTGFELLKRYALGNLSYAAITIKKLSTEVLYNLGFSLILVAGSFYLSLNGAKVFADKREQIEQVRTVEISAQVDSLNLIFDKNLTYKINERDGLIKSRDIYTKKIEDDMYISKLKEYKSLIQQANEEIKRADIEIDRMRSEKEASVANIKNEVTATSELKVNEVFKNQLAFILISIFIEVLILIGVVFHCFFNIKVYNEFQFRSDNTTKLNLYNHYKELLKLTYGVNPNFHTSDMNDTLIIKSPVSLANFNIHIRKKYGDSGLRDFISICNTLKIFVTDANGNFITSVTYGEAKKIILQNFS